MGRKAAGGDNGAPFLRKECFLCILVKTLQCAYHLVQCEENQDSSFTASQTNFIIFQATIGFLGFPGIMVSKYNVHSCHYRKTNKHKFSLYSKSVLTNPVTTDIRKSCLSGCQKDPPVQICCASFGT